MHNNDLVLAIPQNLIRETLLVSSNFSVAIKSLTAVYQAVKYLCSDFPSAVVQAKDLRSSRGKYYLPLCSHVDIVLDYHEDFVKIGQTCSMDVRRDNILRDTFNILQS